VIGTEQRFRAFDREALDSSIHSQVS